MEQAPWPGLCLTIVVYSLNMFGDAVRDLLDPRLRGAAGALDAHRAQPVKWRLTGASRQRSSSVAPDLAPRALMPCKKFDIIVQDPGLPGGL